MGKFSRKRSDRAIRITGGSILFLLTLSGLIVIPDRKKFIVSTTQLPTP